MNSQLRAHAPSERATWISLSSSPQHVSILTKVANRDTYWIGVNWSLTAREQLHHNIYINITNNFTLDDCYYSNGNTTILHNIIIIETTSPQALHHYALKWEHQLQHPPTPPIVSQKLDTWDPPHLDSHLSIFWSYRLHLHASPLIDEFYCWRVCEHNLHSCTPFHSSCSCPHT